MKVPRITSVWAAYSLISGIYLYGFWVLLLIPLWLLFCYFVGIPAIINLLRAREYWSNKDLAIALPVQTIYASLLFIILKFSNAEGAQIYFFIGGIINAFGMPKSELVAERINRIKNQEKNN